MFSMLKMETLNIYKYSSAMINNTYYKNDSDDIIWVLIY